MVLPDFTRLFVIYILHRFRMILQTITPKHSTPEVPYANINTPQHTNVDVSQKQAAFSPSTDSTASTPHSYSAHTVTERSPSEQKHPKRERK